MAPHLIAVAAAAAAAVVVVVAQSGRQVGEGAVVLNDLRTTGVPAVDTKGLLHPAPLQRAPFQRHHVHLQGNTDGGGGVVAVASPTA